MTGADRSESFTVENGALIRRVTPKGGDPYQRSCTLETFVRVAHAFDAAGAGGLTLEDIVQRESVPSSQAATAFAFLKDRGCVAPAPGRKHAAASKAVCTDAMIEWYALLEKGPADEAFGYE